MILQALKNNYNRETTLLTWMLAVWFLVTSQYEQSVYAINNTKLGNKRTRKRNLQQIMQESFFAGANRFGNNFIA